MIHVSCSVTKDCINHDSYGEICVWCNCCGRIDKATMKEAQIKYFEEQLERLLDFDGWMKGFKLIQKKNVKADIKFYKKKLAELKGECKNGCS